MPRGVSNMSASLDTMKYWRALIFTDVPPLFVTVGRKHPKQLLHWRLFKTSPSVQLHLHPYSSFYSSHVEAQACDYNLITRDGNFHINGMINEEYCLTSNWVFWGIWTVVILGAEVACSCLTVITLQWKEEGKRSRAGWCGASQRTNRWSWHCVSMDTWRLWCPSLL